MYNNIALAILPKNSKKIKLYKKERENYALMPFDIKSKNNSLFLYLNILFYLKYLNKEEIKRFVNSLRMEKEDNKR